MGDREVQFDYNPDLEPIDDDVLQVVPNPRPNVNRVDQHTVKEFSTNCPVDYGVNPDDEEDEPDSEGVRDYGELNIEYEPDQYVIELKTLKYYMSSFEDARISHEEVTAKVYQDLANLLFPNEDPEDVRERLHVKFDVNPRGGISSTTWTETMTEDQHDCTTETETEEQTEDECERPITVDLTRAEALTMMQVAWTQEIEMASDGATAGMSRLLGDIGNQIGKEVFSPAMVEWLNEQEEKREEMMEDMQEQMGMGSIESVGEMGGGNRSGFQ